MRVGVRVWVRVRVGVRVWVRVRFRVRVRVSVVLWSNKFVIPRKYMKCRHGGR